MPKKAACTQPTAQTEQSLNLNSAHEMPAVAHAPRFGVYSAAVYNDEIETSHFSDVQAACNLPHRSKRLYDGDSDGKSETYPVELSIKFHKTPVARHCHRGIRPRNLVPAQRLRCRNHHQMIHKPVGHPAYSASNKPRPAARRLSQIGRLSV